MLYTYHKCFTNGTCYVFLWQNSSKHQIVRIKKVKTDLLKKTKVSLIVYWVLFFNNSLITHGIIYQSNSIWIIWFIFFNIYNH